MTERESHHGNRHGRSQEARRAVLAAADDLLAERGFAATTIEGIAARAGVAKQTIYRWWPSKVDILLDVLGDDMQAHLTVPDLGDLERELVQAVNGWAVFLAESDPGAVLRALTGQAQHDPELAARLRTEQLSRQRERDRAPLERAVARGELPAGLDLDVAVAELVGPVHYRVLVTGEPVGPEVAAELVATFLRAHRVEVAGR
jgi:AcrR family transcriptional regulator